MNKDLSGAILAGGQGRRMQSGVEHVEKGLLLLNEKPLVEWLSHVLLQRCTAPLLISANQSIDQYAFFGKVVVDPSYLQAYQGPLAGLIALLESSTTDWLMVLPVDTPFISVATIDALWSAKNQQPERGMYFVKHQRYHPLCLLIHKKWLQPLRQAVKKGQRRVYEWLKDNQALAVDLQHFPSFEFLNINTPEDIKSAQIWAQK